MGPIQEKIAASILNMIRARRESASGGDQSSHSSGDLAPVKIREASFSDFSGVAALKRRWGVAADSPENWERLWHTNPALIHQGCNRPIGWVLEADGVIVGYFGNISLLCRYGARTLTAVASHGLVVDPPYRSISVSLVAAFFRQKSVDLYLSTSAIESVGKIALAFKSSAVPQLDYATVLFWVLQPRPFAQALVKKLELKATVSWVSGTLASAAVGIDNILGRRWPRQSSTALTMSEISVDEIGNDFQALFEALWMEKLNECPRLLTDRSPDALRWHFDIPGDRGSVRVLCCYRNGELAGYAVVRSDIDELSGLNKSLIADMIARRDDPEVVTALFVAAYDYAKGRGSHILEVVGFPPGIRKVCLQWNPYRRKLPACPFFYKAADPVLHNTLSNATAWYATPFDGDATLIRPSYSSSSQLRTPEAQTEDRIENIVSYSEKERTEVF